jgi:hypothetical protein
MGSSVQPMTSAKSGHKRHRQDRRRRKSWVGKSRGVYETPGGTLIMATHRDRIAGLFGRRATKGHLASVTYAQVKTQEFVTGSITLFSTRQPECKPHLTPQPLSAGDDFVRYRQLQSYDAEGFISLLGFLRQFIQALP